MLRRVIASAAGLVLLFGLAPAAASAGPAPQHPGGGPGAEDRPGGVLVETQGEGTGLWVVQLEEPALASYAGGVADLAPTSPRVTGARQLDVAAPHSAAYLSHLEQRQDDVARSIKRAVGRPVEVEQTYRNVFNGMAVRVDRDEAAALARLPGVAAVYRDVETEVATDVSHDLISSASIWDGDTGAGAATRGEGIVVGMLDTGVNPGHPSFAATDADGYTHTNPYGAGNYVGVCDPDHPDHDDICNDKLIGAWNFHPASPSAQDVDGHGSHVGGTIAGNVHDAELTFGENEITRTIRGVAPRANVISYLVCYPTCPQTSSVAAVDQAIEDGVNVLNYSIGGVDSPWTSIVDQAFLDAFNAGIFVAAAAGNAGPGASTAVNTGPWNATVAATTHHRIFAHRVDVTGPAPVPPEAEGVWGSPGSGPAHTADIEAEIRYAGEVAPGNELGCNPFPDGAFTGAIALVERGVCNFSIKVDNADEAGAVAVIVVNDVAGPPTAMGALENTSIPSVMVDRDGGDAIREAVVDNAPEATTARIDVTAETVIDDGWEDTVAGFSSRGPSQFNMLAPTLAAPGVNILAANAADGDDPHQYLVTQGTSMASPHVAGAGALMAALHPDWSPAQIRSALAGTAEPDGLVKDDGVTAADPFDIGSGRIDLDAAGRIGVVLDETHANFVDANPVTGGDPRTLNLPALVDGDCAGSCTFSRTLTSVADVAASYEAVTEAPDGVAVTVEPAEFTLAAGAEQTVEVTVDVDTDVIDEGEWTFGSVALTTGDQHAGGAGIAGIRMPLVITPMAPLPEVPAITVDPTRIMTEQGPGQVTTHPLAIGNSGIADLEWSLTDQAALLPPRDGSTPLARAIPPASLGADAAQFAADSTAGERDGEMFQPEQAPRAASVGQTITHSQSQSVLAGNSAACSPDGGVTTTANGYLRAFTLADFGIPGDFDVTEVEFGVENSSAAFTVTVNLFTVIDPDEPLTYGNMEEIGTADATIASQTLSMVTVPVTGNAEPGATLVVEIDAPDLAGSSGFWPGSNSHGQTAPTYLRAAACGAPEPVDVADLGRPGMHLVMNVTGQTEAPACDAGHGDAWSAVDPTSGTVAPGEEQQVEVTIDSDGVPHGVHEATLCLQSNDPARPLAVVPLTLVLDAPEFDLTAQVRFERGGFYADLSWNPQDGGEVDIVRDGEVVATVTDDGAHTDLLGKPRNGTEFTFQVCQAGAEVCSEEVTVVADRRGGPPGVGPPPQVEITTEQLPDLHALEQYEQLLTASGGSGSYEWHASGLPDGLVLHWQTGVLANDPAAPAITDAGPFEVTITAIDATDPSVSASTTFELSAVGVTQVAAGWGHTCAVTTEETAYCWGRNATGQIGNGEVGGDGVHVNLPTPVLNSEGTGALTGVAEIDGGDGHTCARTTGGEVFCWGASFDGRLGYGDPTIEPQPLPMQVRNADDSGPLTDVVQLVVGGQLGCAVTGEGDALCWGNNASGKLGNGTIGGRQVVPGPVHNSDDSGALTGVTAMAAGSSHVCALGDDEVHCWGNNSQGQLGNGDSHFAEPLPVQVRDSDDSGPLTGVVQLAASAGHTCAVDEDDAAYCWGRNTSGQIGHGQVGSNELLPVRVRDTDNAGPLVGVVEITAGDNHTCARVGSGAYCWGSHIYSQLGNDDLGSVDYAPLPVPVHDRAGDDRFTEVGALTAGNGHTCARTVSGTVDCWGGNFNRQLGIGETGDQFVQPVPAPVHPGLPV